MRHHLFFTFLIALLALTACNDEPESSIDTAHVDVFVTITDNGQDYIYNLNGEMIYQAEPGSTINQLAADGQDWYAVVTTLNHKSSVIKNGTTIYSTTINRISGLAAGNGEYYTLEGEPKYTDDIHWPSEYARFYSIHKNGTLLYDLGLMLDDPFKRLRLCPSSNSKPNVVVEYHSGFDHQLWVNGKEYPLPELYVDPDHLADLDIENNDVLILYWGLYEGKHRFKYWHNNRTDWVDKDLTIGDSGLRQGKVYILGTIYREEKQDGLTYQATQPALYVNGKKKTFDTKSGTNQVAQKMHFHGNSIYVLTADDNSYAGQSYIYKDLKPMKTDSIYLQSKGKKVLLGDLKFNDFIVVDKPTAQ